MVIARHKTQEVPGIRTRSLTAGKMSLPACTMGILIVTLQDF